MPWATTTLATQNLLLCCVFSRDIALEIKYWPNLLIFTKGNLKREPSGNFWNSERGEYILIQIIFFFYQLLHRSMMWCHWSSRIKNTNLLYFWKCSFCPETKMIQWIIENTHVVVQRTLWWLCTFASWTFRVLSWLRFCWL